VLAYTIVQRNSVSHGHRGNGPAQSIGGFMARRRAKAQLLCIDAKGAIRQALDISAAMPLTGSRQSPQIIKL
jgi:hypothetical protein